jgi:zinc/manganese transport system substrate-binding protein/manganese/iron transport system substrate-binding protein
MRRRPIWLIGLAALGVIAIALLASRIPPLNKPSGIRVVTTTTVLADLVNNVGRGKLESVRSVVPAGVDVEDYNPAPADLRAVSEANLFILNGRALDRWAPKLVEAAQPGIPTLTLSDGLLADDSDNPHLWLDPRYAAAYALRIRDKLISLDPDGAATYESNTRAYTSQLEELDSWITQQVATIPEARRKLVTFHDAFPYFAARYGFELVGVITPSPGQEPSAGELAELVQQVRAARVPAVFSEAQFSPRLAQTLADEAGVTRVVSDLYNDSLGEPPADTYIGMMRFNVQRIVQALL